MPRHADNKFIKGFMGAFFILWNLLFFSACSPECDEPEADRLNDISYSYHYRNIDSTRVYAEKAMAQSIYYATGRAEALNNLAYISIVRMDYSKAKKQLDSIASFSDNQIELLISDIQNMRLCQRESRNKSFYDYKEHAVRRMHRIDEEKKLLTPHQLKRLRYAISEFHIVSSTYYYYVGLDKQAKAEIDAIDEDGDIRQDTAQYLNYLYQIGSGGIVDPKSGNDTRQVEVEHLLKCHFMARQYGYTYWEANSLQSISEHIIQPEVRKAICKDNRIAFDVINTDNMPDSLMAGYLAQKSLEMFIGFGDVYQIAASFRTLASCYWALDDYKSSLICLDNALNYNKAIEQAPDMIASIREQLSLVYSAMNDKYNSDINRNIYLDLQEQTRQDRQLDARAEQLRKYSYPLNIMILSIIVLIIIVLVIIAIFYYLQKRRKYRTSSDDLLKPLHKWKIDYDKYIKTLDEEYEQVCESYNVVSISLTNNKRLNIENQAKVFLANSAMPLIDRMLNETNRLCSLREENTDVRSERYGYISELSEKIDDYNNVLTEWIQLRQGQISIHVESFCLGDLFKILEKGSMSFRLKGINLIVNETSDIVKADKVLTLFMINTLADNARKFTPVGGSVNISSAQGDDYIEISVTDTGIGLSEEQADKIFSNNISDGHGFGLVNCRGIINRYRKISSIFRVCKLGVESKEGRGCRFYFRLPKGLIHIMWVFIYLASLLALPCSAFASSGNLHELHVRVEALADSAYRANIKGEYHKTISFTDSAIHTLNKYYEFINPKGKYKIKLLDSIPMNAAELEWLHSNVDVDYGILLSLRDECAVAALALHDWQLYHYNNKVYTQLYKEVSTDRNLAEYCRIMQRAELNKNVAIVILIILLIIIILAYYFLYYRHVLYSRACVDRVRRINEILLGNIENNEKIQLISQLSSDRYPLELRRVVEQIRHTLQQLSDETEKKQAVIEIARDELRRIELENDKLYISNNILDNCLSTLKHETMYYPSRIRLLTESNDANINTIHELLVYYKELYAILSAQIMFQINALKNVCSSIDLSKYISTNLRLRGDVVLFEYMLEILKKQANHKTLEISASAKGERYVELNIILQHVTLTEEQCKNLFTPSVANIPFLICRQIIRNNSEATNLNGCGIVAEPYESGNGIMIRVTMARDNRINNNQDEYI